MQPLVLVLDQGGHSSRALVFAENGSVVAQAACAVSTDMLSGGQVEQDPAQLLSSLRQVLSDVAQQLGARCHHIVSAALIVQRASLLAWNPQTGVCLSPVLSWQDTRHASWLRQQLASRMEWLRERTGLHANAHFGASKMRWLLDYSPSVQQAQQEQTLCIAPLAAFLQQQLTGSTVPLIDAVIASRTLLCELGEREWSDALLQCFGIPRAILPDIQASLADYGTLSCGDAEIPLRLLGGDQSFFAFAHGDHFDDSTALMNVGTGAFVQQRMPVSTVPAALLVSPLLLSEKAEQSVLVAEGTVNAAATALDWWSARHGITLSQSLFVAMTAAIVAAPACVPVFVNRLVASGSPDWLPAGESYFVASMDESEPVSALSELAAVLESIVFALQRNRLLMAIQAPQQRIVLSGGLSRLDVFCQCLADLTGLSVWRSEDAEACARGAALQLLPAMRKHLPSYEQFEPREDTALQARYCAWSRVLDDLSAA